MYDAIVVGAGLFGQVIAEALHTQGRDVVVIDANYKMAGSGPAACLMKPSWFSSLGRAIYEPSLRLLDELYNVRDLKFQTRPKLVDVTVHWIRPAEILGAPVVCAEVGSIDEQRVLTTRGVFEARLIVVAAGIWTERLLPQYTQTGQQGVAFLWRDRDLAGPFIQPWAPYRQMVGFDRGDGYWFSDGTAIKRENWTEERENRSWTRAATTLDCLGRADRESGRARTLLGVRPYARGHKPCLLEEVRPGLWVASGGAKNGTMAAGWCAHVIASKTS